MKKLLLLFSLLFCALHGQAETGNYSAGPLVKAVQELSAKAEQQQAEIEALTLLLDNKKETRDEGNTTDAVLFQNHPNPFSADSDITMSPPETAVQANIIVYNLEGSQLKSIAVRERGNVSLKIQGNELSDGMYIYALLVDNLIIDTKRMILTK